MKIYRWRVENGTYAYLTDEGDKNLPFIYDMAKTKRSYYSTEEPVIKEVNNDEISTVVEKLEYTEYKVKFNVFKQMMLEQYPDFPLLDPQCYYTSDPEECGIESCLEGIATEILFDATAQAGDEADVKVTTSNCNTLLGNVAYQLDFTLPKGDKGEDGKDGKDGVSPVIDKILTTTNTLEAGKNANVKVVKTEANNKITLSFTFDIPKGEKGDTGEGVDVKKDSQGKTTTSIEGNNIIVGGNNTTNTTIKSDNIYLEGNTHLTNVTSQTINTESLTSNTINATILSSTTVNSKNIISDNATIKNLTVTDNVTLPDKLINNITPIGAMLPYLGDLGYISNKYSLKKVNDNFLLACGSSFVIKTVSTYIDSTMNTDIYNYIYCPIYSQISLVGYSKHVLYGYRKNSSTLYTNFTQQEFNEFTYFLNKIIKTCSISNKTFIDTDFRLPSEGVCTFKPLSNYSAQRARIVVDKYNYLCLPDMGNRFPYGNLASNYIGKTGGEANHTLTVSEMPSHKHNIHLWTQNNYVAQTYESGYHATAGTGYDDKFVASPGELNNNSAAGYHQHYISGDTDSTGNGKAHNNLPPYMYTNYIIRYK